MKLHFLGTCAGTEPMPDRNHQSFAIETNGTLYWFDAGAHCSATAHLMGLDLLSVKKVIISHTHMDHIGGLGNLFWDIRKLKHVKNQETKFDEITLYIPEMETWEGFSKILRNTEGGFNGMKISANEIKDGILFSDENMTVTAFHNHHLGTPEDDAWKSFSYLIEVENKRLIYSGDIAELNEMDSLIGAGCDVLLIETGHCHYMDVCDYMNGKNISYLFYTHNGRSILANPDKASKYVQDNFCGKAMICSDGTSFSL